MVLDGAQLAGEPGHALAGEHDLDIMVGTAAAEAQRLPGADASHLGGRPAVGRRDLDDDRLHQPVPGSLTMLSMGASFLPPASPPVDDAAYGERGAPAVFGWVRGECAGGFGQ